MHALHQYVRSHLMLHVCQLQQRLLPPGRTAQPAPAAHKPLDVSQEALDAILRALEQDRRLAEAFARWVRGFRSQDQFLICGWLRPLPGGLKLQALHWVLR